MADDEKTDETSTDEEQTAQARSGEETGAMDENDGNNGIEKKEDDPSFGKKDDEPANDVQMKYLRPLAEEQGEDIPDDMSEADAASKINEMQENAAS